MDGGLDVDAAEGAVAQDRGHVPCGHTGQLQRRAALAHARAEVHLDDKKLWTDQQFEDSLDQWTSGQFFSIPPLREYVERRNAFLASHSRLSNSQVRFDRIDQIPAEPRPGQAVTIAATMGSLVAASKVELYWRTLGPFQIERMKDDGTGGDAQDALIRKGNHDH